MEVVILNENGDNAGNLEIVDEIFKSEVNNNLLYEAIKNELANKRQGTHSTKTRGEVSGGGKKPWRQKGTGRARAGSTRSPIWVGGGKAHTPKPSASGFTIKREPSIIPESSIFFTRWWMAAPDMPHSRAISKKGILAFFTR